MAGLCIYLYIYIYGFILLQHKDFLINKLNSIFNINKSEIKILIVEDNENNRFIIKELLNVRPRIKDKGATSIDPLLIIRSKYVVSLKAIFILSIQSKIL